MIIPAAVPFRGSGRPRPASDPRSSGAEAGRLPLDPSAFRRRPARRPGFLVDDRGSITAEILLWLPLFAELTLLSVDVFWAFWLNAEMWNVAFGAVREVARGNLDIVLSSNVSMEAAVQDWVLRQLGPGYAVTYAETALHHVVTVEADVERMSLFGNLSDVLPSVKASVTMAKEP